MAASAAHGNLGRQRWRGGRGRLAAWSERLDRVRCLVDVALGGGVAGGAGAAGIVVQDAAVVVCPAVPLGEVDRVPGNDEISERDVRVVLWVGHARGC